MKILGSKELKTLKSNGNGMKGKLIPGG